MAHLRLITVCASLLFGVGAFAAATPAAFSYRAEIPSTGASCENNAKVVEALFHQYAGLTTTGSTCVGQNTINEAGHSFKRDIVRVDYLALREARAVKAIFGGQEFMSQVFDHSGLFSSYADCLAQVQTQNQNFQNETGVGSVASYCENSGSVSAPSYSLVIESFGSLNRHLYLFSDIGSRSGLGDPNPDVAQAEAKVITDGGGHIVYSDAGHVFYYSAKPVDISAHTLSYLNSPDQCQSQVSAANTIYSNAGVASVTVLCNSSALTVVSAYSMKVAEYVSSSAPIYSSFNDCMVDRARVLQNFASQGGKPLGAICATGQTSLDTYSIHVFYKGNL